jgi:hypothetical protein
MHERDLHEQTGKERIQEKHNYSHLPPHESSNTMLTSHACTAKVCSAVLVAMSGLRRGMSAFARHGQCDGGAAGLFKLVGCGVSAVHGESFRPAGGLVFDGQLICMKLGLLDETSQADVDCWLHHDNCPLFLTPTHPSHPTVRIPSTTPPTQIRNRN